MARTRNAADVAAWRMCIGCGACAYACPERKIVLQDVEEDGIRPFLKDSDCGGYSLVVVRNEKGRQILREAMEAGYLTLKTVEPDVRSFVPRRISWGNDKRSGEGCWH